VSGSEVTGGLPAGSGDDEAAWRDLVARFDAPVLADKTWPEREDLATADPDGSNRDGTGSDGTGSDAADRDAGDRDSGGGDAGEREERTGSSRAARAETDTLPGFGPLPASETVTFSSAPRDWTEVPAPEDEHFIPPPPPPLPSIDPVTKGAWAALFGGPAYLLIATAAGWTVPGIAAFCAVAAFVGGFAVLVLRMDDGPRDSGGPDDGAVV
jgi:hypothetical protein